MKQVNYYVISGQEGCYYYGGTPTLIGARRLANRNQEYRHHWITPNIWRAEDTELIPWNPDVWCQNSDMVRVPQRYTYPVVRIKGKDYYGPAWSDSELVQIQR